MKLNSPSLMRKHFAGNFGAADAGFGNVHGVEVKHAVAFEHVEGVAEGAEHGVVADARDFLEAGNNGHCGAQRTPASAAEVALDSEGENLPVFIGLRHAEPFNHSFHLFRVAD